MKSGLLWFDPSNAPVADKIRDASKRYLEKFGYAPNLCFVNARHLVEPITVEGMIIREKHTIMPNHVWIGVIE